MKKKTRRKIPPFDRLRYTIAVKAIEYIFFVYVMLLFEYNIQQLPFSHILSFLSFCVCVCVRYIKKLNYTHRFSSWLSWKIVQYIRWMVNSSNTKVEDVRDINVSNIHMFHMQWCTMNSVPCSMMFNLDNTRSHSLSHSSSAYARWQTSVPFINREIFGCCCRIPFIYLFI